MAIEVKSSLTQGDNGVAAVGLLLQVRDLHIPASLPGKRAGLSQAADQVSDVSFQIEPGELVVLWGPCRPAKSHLLRVLAGIGHKPDGEILINGVELYAYLKQFAPYIGYVFSQPAFHSQLTVQEILDYEVRLRIPGRPSKSARRDRVREVLESLDIPALASRRFGELTNYQKYLTSIAVEWIGAPGILLLDSPLESLEPAEEIQLSGLLKGIASHGVTIIQSAGSARCAQTADKVLVLASDGSQAWFGPADAALAYFEEFVLVREAGGNPLTFDAVQEILSAPYHEKGAANLVGSADTADGAATWAERFQNSSAYTTYVDDPLNDKYPDLQMQERPLARFRGISKEKTPPKKIPQPGSTRKFSALVSRGMQVLGRGRAGFWLLLAPPLVALADFLISSPQMFDPLLGDPVRVPIALGLLVFMEMLVAALVFHNEIARERPLIQRERRTLSLAWPYTLSKIWLVVLAALYQGLVWGLIHFFASGMVGGTSKLPSLWITLVLVALTGGLLGLIASSFARSAHGAILLTLILTIPQLLLSGSVLPLSRLSPAARALSLGTPARYAFETLLTISGYGADVAGDACWRISDVMRNTLTEADKQKCTCLGDNIFSKCNFPGIHKFFTFVIEQPQPVAPTPGVDLNKAPTQPAPKPGESLDTFNQTLNSYAQQQAQYQGQVAAYTESLQQYTRDLANWQRLRSQVTGNAEGVIALALDQYGQGFQVNSLGHWLVLLGLSLILATLLLVLQQRKGYEI